MRDCEARLRIRNGRTLAHLLTAQIGVQYFRRPVQADSSILYKGLGEMNAKELFEVRDHDGPNQPPVAQGHPQ